MDLGTVILSELSQTEKNKYHTIITYMWNLKKMAQINSFTKQKQKNRKQTYNYSWVSRQW